MELMRARTSVVCVFWMVLLCVTSANHRLHPTDSTPIQYNMAELYRLRTLSTTARPVLDLPSEMKPRKRGRRGGARQRNKRRKCKPYLPTIIMGNVQSLSNKIDELSATVSFREEFRTCSLLCFSETWLSDKIADSCVDIDGFTLNRGDRNKDSGKRTGGGVGLFVSNKWCHPNNVSVKQVLCSPTVEFLTVSCRPYYLPREFSHVLVTVVYVPPSANARAAADTIASHVNDLETSAPDAFKVITGDFNHCTLKRDLPIHPSLCHLLVAPTIT
ncbi:hypothetical protein BaRGS_00025397 [Batillaria attramentaria]|uniref:Endonuclease/exonuclease/phosphatase domain-containing protein n=1 Tax=Batillaria attramentaria TaxID=370345 RepID=A0ABD0K8E0_9CAEN